MPMTRLRSFLIIISQGMLLISCSFVKFNCEPINPSSSKCSIFHTEEEIDITIEEAISKGFPIFLPSDEALDRRGISSQPSVHFKGLNKECSYIEIIYYYNNDLNEQAINIEISNGCTLDLLRGYETDFAWARDGVALVMNENDNYSRISFLEPTQSFRYLVFSEENQVTTMEILNTIDKGSN